MTGLPVLTLQLPRDGRGLPVAISSNPDVLAHFGEVVLAEAGRAVADAGDEIEAAVHRAELERLRRVLALLLPGVR